MAKKLELSWIGTLKQWRKRRKVGEKTKTWYLGTGNGKGDAESYKRALAKWKVIEQSLIPQPFMDPDTDAFDQGMEYLRAYPGTAATTAKKSKAGAEQYCWCQRSRGSGRYNCWQ